MLPDIAIALVPITTAAWKTAQHFSYGARGFMRVPVSEANDLNYLLCWKDWFLFINYRIRNDIAEFARNADLLLIRVNGVW
jgi:hypothetical protein